MKKFLNVVIVALLALGFASCSSSDDDVLSISTEKSSVVSSFSLLDYQQSETMAVAQDGSNAEGMDEKLVCKILKGGQLQLTHKNVVFDDGTNITLKASLQGKQLIVMENGAYGDSGNYGYYTLTATVGSLADGDYTIVVKRNDNIRATFQMTYDSSKAK